ncbi:hypothetical protein AGDE_14700 [Angomonas deanei]|uniref:Autophagy-related protein 9 n=1 Tax=Angomonas deanei TaxID=59799 RepID=A0A7G2CBH0_9TRYP|nr:hypothetical protein AGDE_14700 [Angomonas deanei]CAD2215382.1 Autophagy protein Apg9, putative [Angomonas deanei]|eukprot:EPY20396.1 hypothetical protein AGDE_14700 [Angomonas deanei]
MILSHFFGSLFAKDSFVPNDRRCFAEFLYEFWLKKGYWGVFRSNLVDFIIALFLYIICVLFTMCFRWDAAMSCTSDTCDSTALFQGPSLPHVVTKAFVGYLLGVAIVVSSFLSVVYELLYFLQSSLLHLDISRLVKHAGIVDDTGVLGFASVADSVANGGELLSCISWSDFVERVSGYMNAHEQGRFGQSHTVLTPLNILQSLLQVDNYMVLMYEADVISENSPLEYLHPLACQKLFNLFFNDYNEIEYSSTTLIRVKMVVLAYSAFHIAFLLFVLVYRVLRTATTYAGDARTNFRTFLHREWSSRARWKFRLYNEVEHLHESRLADGLEVANEILSHFNGSSNATKLVRRLTSTCIFVLVVFDRPQLWSFIKVSRGVVDQCAAGAVSALGATRPQTTRVQLPR